MNDPVSDPTGRAFRWHARRRDWTNFSFRRHQAFDGYIVTMHQSGTHWLKYLLTLLIAREHGFPVPDSISENIVIGGPRQKPRYETSPRIGHSHTIPSPLLKYAMVAPGCRFPNYLVLVRDIRDVLAAHYRKWRDRYDCSFSVYLRGDVTHRRFEKDVWWDFRYMNAWGEIACARPQRVLALRYEDLRADPHAAVRRIIDFFNIPVADRGAAIEYAVAGSSKAIMAEKDPHPYGLPVVQDEIRDWQDWYGPDDRAWLTDACARHLRHDFGYDYARWT